MPTRLVPMLLVLSLAGACATERSAPPPYTESARHPAIEPAPAAEPEIARPPLEDLAAWDAAGSEERAAIAVEIAQLMPEVALEEMRTFECGSQRHEIAVFRHKATGIEMCLVPGGVGTCGCHDDDEDQPSHPVRTSPFLVARTELTSATWSRVAGAAPPDADRDAPVVACYDEIAAFCAKAGLQMPSPAQWEHAARSGSKSRFCFGDDSAAGVEYGWLLDNSGKRLHDVAAKPCNAFGLFDVIGNAREWCRPVSDAEPEREARGSSYDRRASACTRRVPSGCTSSRFGFRPVLALRVVAGEVATRQ